MVRKERLELSRVAPQESKSCASTSSATFARAAFAGRSAHYSQPSWWPCLHVNAARRATTPPGHFGCQRYAHLQAPHPKAIEEFIFIKKHCITWHYIIFREILSPPSAAAATPVVTLVCQGQDTVRNPGPEFRAALGRIIAAIRGRSVTTVVGEVLDGIDAGRRRS